MSLSKEEKEKKDRLAQIQRVYASRITIAKDGRKYFLEKEYGKAAQRYHEYLESLKDVKELESIYDLKPKHFDPESDVAEMLLISHIFWELSRIYELTPKLQDAFQKCLNQFVRFTVDQKFQVMNSEMLRKYLKNNKYKIKQYQQLKDAYGKIQSDSQGCYISSLCFGSTHPITNEIRNMKPHLMKHKTGKLFIESYYRFSFKFIELPNILGVKSLFICLTKPLLYTLGTFLILIKRVFN